MYHNHIIIINYYDIWSLNIYVASLRNVRLSATFGLRFIVLSYRAHQYEHLVETIIYLAPLSTEI